MASGRSCRGGLGQPGIDLADRARPTRGRLPRATPRGRRQVGHRAIDRPGPSGPQRCGAGSTGPGRRSPGRRSRRIGAGSAGSGSSPISGSGRQRIGYGRWGEFVGVARRRVRRREPGRAARPDVIDLLRRGANLALDAALPAQCVGCGREGPPLCAACVPALDRRLEAPAGVPIGLPGDLPAPLLQLDWCAPFSGTVRAALHAIKYGGRAAAGRAPRGRDRPALGTGRRRRGPRHARARPFRQGPRRAATTRPSSSPEPPRITSRLPYAPLLARERATIAQFDLDRSDRAANVAGAFAVRPPHSADARDVVGRWVLLVDDVVTTGATLAACADALERAGALGTSAITVARER